MEFAKREVAAVKEVVLEVEIQQLTELELCFVGGGSGDVHLA
jgi:hypothetical protein